MWTLVADSSMGGALRTVIEVERERAVTAQLDLRWLRPVRGDALRSVGRLIRRGRTLSYCTAEIFDARDELVGSASGTFMVVSTVTEDSVPLR
jgi:acyl-coenzyme A thioesterase PaaI-like protein